MTNTKLTNQEYAILKEVYPPFCPHCYDDNLVAVYLNHDWLLDQWLTVNKGHAQKLACVITDINRLREMGYDDDDAIARLTMVMKHAG